MNMHLGDNLFILRMYRNRKTPNPEEKKKEGEWEEEEELDGEEINDSDDNRRDSFLDKVAAMRYSRKAMFNVSPLLGDILKNISMCQWCIKT